MQIGDYLKTELSNFVEEPKKKRGGINGQITAIRAQIAEMLDIQIVRVCRMTKNWTHDQMYFLYNECQGFVNPPALFWKKYKVLKLKYGKNKKIINKSTDKRGLCSLGQEVGREEQDQRQGVLF